MYIKHVCIYIYDSGPQPCATAVQGVDGDDGVVVQAESIEKPALLLDQIKETNKMLRKDPDNEVRP